MKILSVLDPAFQNYGQVLTGYDCKALLETLEAVTPLPAGVEYVPQQPELMALPVAKELASGAYGGMPIQLGWCNGHNTKLNCLEYHRDSELNLGARDFILLVAKREDMEGGRLDTAKVQAFHCPACTMPPALPARGRGSGFSLCSPWEPTVPSRRWSPRMRRTGVFGPATSGSWPMRRAARRHKARRCCWTGSIWTLRPSSHNPRGSIRACVGSGVHRSEEGFAQADS